MFKITEYDPATNAPIATATYTTRRALIRDYPMCTETFRAHAYRGPFTLRDGRVCAITGDDLVFPKFRA